MVALLQDLSQMLRSGVLALPVHIAAAPRALPQPLNRFLVIGAQLVLTPLRACTCVLFLLLLQTCLKTGGINLMPAPVVLDPRNPIHQDGTEFAAVNPNK